MDEMCQGEKELDWKFDRNIKCQTVKSSMAWLDSILKGNSGKISILRPGSILAAFELTRFENGIQMNKVIEKWWSKDQNTGLRT